MVSKDIIDLRDAIASMECELRAAQNRLRDLEIAESPMKVGTLLRRTAKRGCGAKATVFEGGPE